MKGKKIIAELLDPGGCRHYSREQKFELTGGFKPAGFCDSGYLAASKALKILLKENSLPGEANDKILAQCPRPHGAVWEVRLEDVIEPLDEEIDNIIGNLEDDYPEHCKNR